MSSPRIVCLDTAPTDAGDLSWASFEALGELILYADTRPEQVVERLQGATVAVTNKVRLTGDLLRACPSLRMIAELATGYDNIDLATARELGITVSNVPGYSTSSTAQLAIHLLLELAFNVGAHNRSVHEGRWAASPTFCYWLHPLTELDGKTLVLVGQGAIGSRVRAIAEAIGMEVLAAQIPGRAPRADRIPFAEAIGRADAISLHCPLSDATRGLFGRETLAAMKPGAWLVNTARGPIVDDLAIRQALDSGQLGGYAADVLTHEPPSADHPLFGAPRCILTPHIGWATREARTRLVEQAARNIAAFLKGAPIHQV